PAGEDNRVRPLVMFLVGDTPTGGIHKQALDTCLSIIEWFQLKDPQQRQHPELKIVGPAFSGSQHSLQIALHNWWSRRDGMSCDVRRKWRIDVRGTSAALQPARFAAAFPLTPDKTPFLYPAPGELRFSTSCVPDRVLTAHLLRYLRELHWPWSRIRVARL